MAKRFRLPRQLRVTTGYLHVISASHLLLGMAVMINAAYKFLQSSFAAFMIVAIFGVILVLLAVGFEIINAGLKELSYWAWITALITCSIHLLAAFMILMTLGDWGIIGSLIFLISGAVGLWGLMTKETRGAFIPPRQVVKQS